MLDKKVFREQMEHLTNLYPSWTIKIEDSKVMASWYSQFEKFENEQFLETVKDYVKKERFNPTVAGLLEHMAPRKTPVKLERVERYV